ncbi:DUF3892 domain-containing protein [Neobacillus notoginsengisoli]|uniref:DUF3892 domain-containing protein n=1 Tax=Neobacillus notoginsengisoli TaxID=1578198 RepID=A0A417YRP3_9BACI|nr:DUF3892 domain-containing protein [Neobacillus notoginsengisoli]RHW37303.1 DUF3892 domain-containing protein [Neobacillus notoginsengisoli]
MTKRKLKPIAESSTGLNTRYQDVSTKKELTLNQAVKAVKQGKYPGIHVVERKDGTIFIRSNPDGKENNNLE